MILEHFYSTSWNWSICILLLLYVKKTQYCPTFLSSCFVSLSLPPGVNLEMQCLAHRRLLSVSHTQHTNDFALYTEAIKFFNHPESMVRIAVRTITLNVYKGERTCTRKPVHLLTNTSSGDAGTAYCLFLCFLLFSAHYSAAWLIAVLDFYCSLWCLLGKKSPQLITQESRIEVLTKYIRERYGPYIQMHISLQIYHRVCPYSTSHISLSTHRNIYLLSPSWESWRGFPGDRHSYHVQTKTTQLFKWSKGEGK